MKKLFFTLGLLTILTRAFGYVAVLTDTNGVLKSPTNLFSANLTALTNALATGGFSGGNPNALTNGSPLNATNVTGTLTNNTSGNAATAGTATLANSALNGTPLNLAVTNLTATFSGGNTGSVQVVNQAIVLKVGNTNSVSSGLTTNQMTYLGWNIPAPDYSWDAAYQPNNGTSVSNITAALSVIYDDTGNPSNKLYCSDYNGFNVTLPYSPTILNGQPGFGLGSYSVIATNATILAGGVTNFTLFIVYRDIDSSQTAVGLFGIGRSGDNGLYSMAYNNLDDVEFFFKTWNMGLGRNSYASYFPMMNNRVECQMIRYDSSKPTDPTIWVDGALLESIGNNGNTGATYLTNGSVFCLGGTAAFLNGSSAVRFGECKLYLRGLSDYDAQRMLKYYRTRYNINNKALYLLGDSITAGSGHMAQYSNLTECVSRLLPQYEVCNDGIAGIRTDQIYTNQLRLANQGKWPSGTIATLLSGANDVSQQGATNGFTTFTNFTTKIVNLYRTNNIPILLVTHYSTLLEEVTYPTFRTNVNTWLSNNWQTIGAAGLIDLATNQYIGPMGSYTNGLYILQADQLHLVTNSYPLIYAPAIANAVKGIQ